MRSLANSADPDEMQHNAAFHQGLHCLIRTKQSSGTGIYHNLENSMCDFLKYTMGSAIFLYQHVWENSSEYKELVDQSVKLFNSLRAG